MNEELVQRCLDYGIHSYSGSYDEGILLARWWEEVTESGDIALLFPRGLHPVQHFMHAFAPPRALFYTQRDDGTLNRAVWLERVPSSPNCIHFGAWLSPGQRQSKRTIQIMDAIYLTVFDSKDVILGTTKQQRILDLHRKMGYTVLGPIPMLFDGEAGYIVYCTKQSYEESKFHRTAQRSLR